MKLLSPPIKTRNFLVYLYQAICQDEDVILRFVHGVLAPLTPPQ